jgi:hypothetical protein
MAHGSAGPVIRLAAALAVGAACTPSFDDPSNVKDLRVLVVVAEPPEILVDEQDPSQALVPVVLRPLVVDPRGPGRAVTYSVRACGNRVEGSSEGRNMGPGTVRDTVSQSPCPPDAFVVADGTAEVGPDGLAPIEVTFTPTIELLTKALMADPLGATLGLPITVAFTIGAGGEQVVVIKRVIYSPRLSPEHKPNANPRIDMLFHRRTKADAVTPWEADAIPEVSVDGELHIRPNKTEGEAYEARALSRQGQMIVEKVPHETLRYRFYATKGTFSPGQVSSDARPIFDNPVVDLESTYNAPATLAPGESPDVDVFIVVRDERGGASFKQARLRLRP